MKLFIILILILIANSSLAQGDSKLQGKWKVTAISQVVSSSGDSLYYSLCQDSIYIPPADLREAARDGLDSIQAVNLFKGMYGSLKNSTITFAGDSVIVEYGMSRAIGTFHIKGTDEVTMDLFFEENESEDITYIFILKGDILELILKQDIGYTRFVYRKE